MEPNREGVEMTQAPINVVATDTGPDIGALIARYPRLPLGVYPTPLEEMKPLSAHLGGPRLFVKRDDCTGFAMGGNKVRQLEFPFGDALAKGANTVISASAIQSNHLRVIAAAAARHGLACEIVRERRVPIAAEEYAFSGNALLQSLFNAKVHYYDDGENDDAVDVVLGEIADRVRGEGGNPYIIGVGIANPPLGALAYVEATAELLGQCAERGITVDAIVVPSGSAATHAGTLVGLRAAGKRIPVYGICVRRNRDKQAQRVARRVHETAELLGRPDLGSDADVWVTDEYLGRGYGLPTADTLATVRLVARLEGLLLDPVYTGKTMTGLIGLVRQKVLKPDSTVVFVHTGGTPALFAYRELLFK
jgi:D-cysteine desulfhydrase family pyridoxal phosphate-dependent enzyme